MITIFNQELSGFVYDSTYGAYAFGVNPHPFTLVLGDTYTVTWDGVTYECTSQDMSALAAGCIAIGDLSAFGGTGNSEPFVIAWIPGGVTFFSFAEGESHTVEIQAHSNVVYSAQGIALTDGGAEVAVCGLVIGEEYTVTINGTEHTLIAKEVSTEDGLSISYVGNMGLIDSIYEDTGENFVFYDVTAANVAVIFCPTASTVDLTIAIAVSEETDPVGIIMKNYYGENVAYYGLETVSFNTTDMGEVTFTKGIKTQKKVSADFSAGDQVVQAGEGELYDRVTVEKPENLLPENIRNGVEVAGIEGTFIGDAEEVTVDLAMADGDQVITPSAEGKVISQVTIKKPETLVPENIVSGVDIGGVVGNVSAPETEEASVTLDFSGGDMEILPDDGKLFSKVNIPKPEMLFAENVAEGVDIAGIIGTLAASVGGGCVVSSGTSKGVSIATISHGLGVTPDLLLLWEAVNPAGYVALAFGLSQALADKLGLTTAQVNASKSTSSSTKLKMYVSQSPIDSASIASTAAFGEANETTFKIGSTNVYMSTGYTYNWIAIGGLV